MHVISLIMERCYCLASWLRAAALRLRKDIYPLREVGQSLFEQ